MHVIARSRVRVFIELLDAIKNCAGILIQAEEDDRISFDDEVVPVSLEIGSHVLAQASRMNSDELDHFLNHVKVDGPRMSGNDKGNGQSATAGHASDIFDREVSQTALGKRSVAKHGRHIKLCNRHLW
jgi:hypothetical protein